METTTTRWTAGERVIVRATSCTITRAERFADCEGLRLAPHVLPDTSFGTLLVPFDRPHRIEEDRRIRAVRPRRWLHALRRAGADHRPFGGLRCAANARIDLLPYQLEPALAMMRHGSLRVLLADAVGLGKTIQAGLVLAEVLDRDSSRRALVLVPAGLRHQWQSELAAHFEIAAPVCDAAWLRQRTRELPPDANPWGLPGTYVASLDFIKRPEVLKPIEELLWDLVIVDEAHLVASGTDRRAAVDAVATRARRVLLLTGTPHSGDEAQFDALCRIGEGPAWAPHRAQNARRGPRRTAIVMFRRRRSDVAETVPRRSVLLPVRLSDAEHRMHQLLDRYASQVWRESHARGDRRARLVAIVLKKRALSSAGSLTASLVRRIDLLSTRNALAELQLTLPLQDNEDDVEDCVRDDLLAAPGLADPVRERRWLVTLLEAARRAAQHERKIARLCRLLTRIAEPAIIFTEYRDTLARLQRTLERHGRLVLALHGGMSATDRRVVQQVFNDRPSLLLATDAAAVGLNLQRWCRLVIHYELPWNPLRLEQRIGRVDRIGQTRRVHEIALIADGTAERIVLAPLARRAGRAKELAASGGRMLELLSESRVAEAVMAGGPEPLANVPEVRFACSQPQLTDEATREASRVVQQREWLASADNSRSVRGPAVTVLGARNSLDAPRMDLVYTLSLVASDGRVVHSEPLVIGVTLRSHLAEVRTTAGAVHALEQVLARVQPTIDELIAEHWNAIESSIMPLYRTLISSLREREMAITQFHSSAARQLVQAGLFDRRALREAEQQHARRDRRIEEADETLKALAAPGSLARSLRLEAGLIRARG